MGSHCQGMIPFLILLQTCVSCGQPKPLEENTMMAPKVICDGDGSSKTVYGQRCKPLEKTNNKSSCMMGSEGFTWCSTEHLWWRDDHWFDWDLCSLCGDQSGQVLTTSGHECAGPCHNRHNNRESMAPRCKTKSPDADGIGMDYCTSCQGDGCPDENSAPKDDRPGYMVGNIKWETGGNLGEDIIKQMQESMETNDITMQESMDSEEEESQMPGDRVQEELSLDEEDLMDLYE